MLVNEGSFVVGGIQYEELPSRFEYSSGDTGVRTSSRKLLGGKRVVSINSAADTGDYTHLRKVKKQSWKGTWEANNTAMGEELKAHLTYLYQTQTPAYIQLDDEMSRCYAKLVAANDVTDPDGYKAYFTPTYPIFPYSYTTGDTVTWGAAYDIVIDNEYYDGDYTVDQETGLLLLPPSSKVFTNTTKVYFRYQWRAYVRVAGLELSSTTIPQTYYTGEVMFEQLTFPE